MTESKPLDLLLTHLGEVSGQLQEMDEERDDMIRAARKAGASFEQIGEAMGISKQAAWERYRHIAARAANDVGEPG